VNDDPPSADAKYVSVPLPWQRAEVPDIVGETTGPTTVTLTEEPVAEPLQPNAVTDIVAVPENELLHVTIPEEEIVPAPDVMPQL
jgi:hypothetical protein